MTLTRPYFQIADDYQNLISVEVCIHFRLRLVIKPQYYLSCRLQFRQTTPKYTSLT
jgi:hypothetical protein